MAAKENNQKNWKGREDWQKAKKSRNQSKGKQTFDKEAKTWNR